MRRCLRKDLHRPLVTQTAAGLDRIFQVQIGRVVRRNSRRDAALSPSGTTRLQVRSCDDGDLPVFPGSTKRRIKTGVAREGMVAVTEGLKFQIRGEFLNAFNHPQFADPNTDPTNSGFAKTTGQNNLPRNVQIGLKLIF